MAVCLIPLGHYTHIPLQVILQAYVQKVKSKLSLIKNPHNMHVHNSLSKVAIHMPCNNIQYAVVYIINWKWFSHVHDYLQLQWVTCTPHRSHCIYLSLQQNNEVYVANSHLISNTCTVISTRQNFHAKIFSWGTHEN